MPVLVLFTFTFLIIKSEFFDKRVNTRKNEQELISPGMLYIKPSKLY